LTWHSDGSADGAVFWVVRTHITRRIPRLASCLSSRRTDAQLP
jgi:hypothetical protein